MKKIFMFIPCLAMLFATSCSEDSVEIFEEDRTDIVAPDTLWYEVTNVTKFTLDEFGDSISKSSSSLAGSVAMLKGMLSAQMGPSVSQLSFLNITYNYKSKGHDGKTTNLSAMLTIPSVQGILLKQKLIVDNHGTITANADAPTLHWNSGILMAMTGVPVVATDLLGYSASYAEPLNYCCYHMAGKNIADGVMVAQQMLHSNWVNLVALNESLPVYNVGYSQGGYDAMALQRYIEKDATAEEKALLPLKKTYCGDGPYTLQTMMDVVQVMPVYMYTPFLLAGVMSTMNYHPELYPAGTTINDVVTDAVANSEVLDLLATKGNNSAYIIGKYTEAVGGYMPMSAAFIPDVMDLSGTWHQTIHKALENEDITVDWKPEAPIWMYHATNDDCVPVQCSRNAVANFGSNPSVTYVEDPTIPAMFGAHSMAGSNFMLSVLQMGWE